MAGEDLRASSHLHTPAGHRLGLTLRIRSVAKPQTLHHVVERGEVDNVIVESETTTCSLQRARSTHPRATAR